MPLLPWCWHQRCTPSDIVPPAPGPRYRPSEVGNTHPFENIHVHAHSITSIFISISPDVKQKHSWFFSYSVVLQNMYVSMTCLLRFFLLTKYSSNFSSENHLQHFFLFLYEFIWHSIVHFYNTLLKCWLRNSLILASLEHYLASSSPSPFSPGRRGLFLSQPLTNKQTKH